MTVKLSPGGSVLAVTCRPQSALQGGTVEMIGFNAGILAVQVGQGVAVYDFFLFGNAQEADAVHPTALRPEAAGAPRREADARPGPTGSGQPHQQLPPGGQGRGHRGPEGAGDPVADLHRPVQYAGRQRDAAAVPELFLALGAARGRRAGEPQHGDPVLRFAEVQKQTTQTRHIYNLAGAYHQQEVLGHARPTRRSAGAHRFRRRGHRLPAPGGRAAPPTRRWPRSSSRHDGDRAAAGRSRQAAREGQARDRQGTPGQRGRGPPSRN